MGGGYYDRDDNMISSISITQNQQITNSNFQYSTVADQKVGKLQEIHPSMDPKRWKDSNLESNEANPIVFGLDVTGSMGEWSKIIYDKLPMFYGQIMLQKYLKNPSISFCAIGDAKTDSAPLQISNFAQGGDLDETLCNLYLEGNGGGNNHESYDLAAYFYVSKVQLINWHIPFFFLTCDEMFWEECSKFNFFKIFGHGPPENQSIFKTLQYWKKLMDKYNVFLLRKELQNKNFEPNVQKKWCEALGSERVLKISNPKAVVDVILGAICLTSSTRTLEEYIEDLKDRGQTEERISEVVSLLTPYYESLKNKSVNIVFNSEYKETIEEENKNKNKLEEIKNYFVNQTNEDQIFLSNQYYKDLIKLSKELEGKIPEELTCPITNFIICNPVKLSNGKVYEEIAIKKWMESSDKDPINGDDINKGYIIDYPTQEKVYEFYENSKIYLEL